MNWFWLGNLLTTVLATAGFFAAFPFFGGHTGWPVGIAFILVYAAMLALLLSTSESRWGREVPSKGICLFLAILGIVFPGLNVAIRFGKTVDNAHLFAALVILPFFPVLVFALVAATGGQHFWVVCGPAIVLVIQGMIALAFPDKEPKAATQN